MSTNEFGLDYQYFSKKMIGINSSLENYRPHELAREFARLSVTADSEVIHEEEFEKPSIKTDNTQVIINQDKKIAELESLLIVAKDLMTEITTSHQNKQSPDYNDCESGLCQWCEEAQPIITKELM